MKVKSLETLNFRNLEDGACFFDEGVNVIFGNNAQGKTNLVECIWLFTGAKSFRGSRENDYIRFGEEFSAASMSFFSQGREQRAQIRFGTERGVILNGVHQRAASGLSGSFCSVVFSPGDVSLISEGPSERRRFLDSTLSQIKPKYSAALGEYTRAIAQRAALLRDVKYHRDLEPLLDVYESAAASAGAYIVTTRKNYIDFISPSASQYYGGISGGKEELTLSYEPTGNETDTREGLELSLKNSRSEDILTGNTSVGPHRDDMSVLINGAAARAFGSQGQKRSAALSLKLAEANTLMTFTNEPPVILLDDVMSELDSGRKKYILNSLGDRQIFITCCARGDLRGLKAGRTFKMKAGRLSQMK